MKNQEKNHDLRKNRVHSTGVNVPRKEKVSEKAELDRGRPAEGDRLYLLSPALAMLLPSPPLRGRGVGGEGVWVAPYPSPPEYRGRGEKDKESDICHAGLSNTMLHVIAAALGLSGVQNCFHLQRGHRQRRETTIDTGRLVIAHAPGCSFGDFIEEINRDSQGS